MEGEFIVYRSFRAAFAALLLLSLSACVTTNASRLGSASTDRPVVEPERVALYRVASQVPGRYEEVALLNSKGDSNWTDEARMFDSMRKTAGKMGANAIILDAVSEPGHGAKVAAAIFGVSAQRKGSAVAIWVLPEGGSTVGGVAPATTPQPVQAIPYAAAPVRAGGVVPPMAAQPYQADPAKRCDACTRLGTP
jgi:hypothetical protein